MKNTYAVIMRLLSYQLGRMFLNEIIKRGLLIYNQDTVIIMLVCMAED